jgi:hypothetical protein
MNRLVETMFRDEKSNIYFLPLLKFQEKPIAAQLKLGPLVYSVRRMEVDINSLLDLCESCPGEKNIISLTAICRR